MTDRALPTLLSASVPSSWTLLNFSLAVLFWPNCCNKPGTHCTAVLWNPAPTVAQAMPSTAGTSPQTCSQFPPCTSHHRPGIEASHTISRILGNIPSLPYYQHWAWPWWPRYRIGNNSWSVCTPGPFWRSCAKAITFLRCCTLILLYFILYYSK